MRLGLATAVLAMLAVALWAVPSGAHDSRAPRGAHHHWLPNETWSHKHWIPFDESRLSDDHHTIAQLARGRE